MNEQENETKDLVVNKGTAIDFGNYYSGQRKLPEQITNIKDEKKLFNLDSGVDYKLNDCEGESLRIKEVLIRRFHKKLDTPIVDEETGEIKDEETSVSTILIDDNDKSYATGSKLFTFRLIRYLSECGGSEKLEKEGFFEIKIIKTKYGDKGNKALSFELI